MPVTNWAGNVTFGAASLRRPATVAELRQLVAESPRLHALGTGHSFSPVADSPGELVSAGALPATARTGRKGERLPHFRAGSTPSAGDELQSEYLLPRGAAVAALAALDPLAGRIAPLLRTAEIRTAAADDLRLSPCHRRDTVGFHFTWHKDAAAVTPLLAAIEERLAPFAQWGRWRQRPRLMGPPTPTTPQPLPPGDVDCAIGVPGPAGGQRPLAVKVYACRFQWPGATGVTTNWRR